MARKHLVSFVSSFMLQAASYASDEALLAFDGHVRYATAADDRPLTQPPSTFKHGHPQQSLARHMDTIPAGSLAHPSTADQSRSTYSTATASEFASHQPLTEGPSQTTGRELRPSAILNSAPTANDDQPSPGPAPAPESLTKKSHARKQPDGHIPRPRNAFILFRCDFVAQKKIPASVEPDHRNISRIVGRIWKAMGDEDRRPWVEEAKRERERHKRLYPQYRYSPTSTATTGVVSPLKEKRTHYQKVRESMGVLPAWEVTPHTGSPAQSSLSQRTQELQSTVVPQAEMLSRAGDIPSDVPWRTPAALDCGDSASLHTMSGEPSFTQLVNWGTPSQSQPDWSAASNAEPQHCPVQGLTSPPSPSQKAVPFDNLAASSHFDSPDPSPVQMTQILPPFMFVAGHHLTTNSEFPTSHYSPTVGDVSTPALPFVHSSARVDDPALQYRPLPHGLEMNTENFFDGPDWTTDQIEDLIRNIESGSSLDYASQQPNPFINH